MPTNQKNKDDSKYLFDFFANSPIAYQSLTMDGNIIEVNKKWLSVLGYKKTEVIGEKFANFLTTGSKIFFEKSFKQFKKNGNVKCKVFSMKTKNGKEKIVSFNGNIFYDNELKIRRSHCVMVDITKDQIVNNELKKSREKYKALTEMSTEAIVVIQDSEIKYFNKRFLEISGYSAKSLDLAKFINFVHPGDRKNLLARHKKRMNGYKGLMEYKFRGIVKDKKIIYIKNKSGYIEWEGRPASINLISDISEKEKNDKILEEALKMNKYILDNSPVGKFVIDKKGSVIYVNIKMLELAGVSQKKFSNINFLKNSGYKKIGLLEKINKCFLGKKFEMKNIEYVSQHSKKYSIRNFIGLPIKNMGETNVIIMVEDITKLKKKELELQKEAKQWQGVFDSMKTGVSVHDKNGKILDINKMICEILGKAKKDIVGKKCFQIFTAICSVDEGCRFRESIKKNESASFKYFDKKINKWIMTTSSPVFNENGVLEKTIYSMLDITEDKNKENDLKNKRDEMEIFNKIAVDRELKMIELKQEIARLKEKNN